MYIRTGNLRETAAGKSYALTNNQKLVATASSSTGIYVGIKDTSSTMSLSNAMYLSPSDANGSFYSDLSGCDLSAEYYFGFGTNAGGGSGIYYFKEIRLTNKIDDMGAIEKTFTYSLTNAVG